MALDLGELLVRLRVDDSQYRAGLAAAPQTARKAGQQIGDGITRGADGSLKGSRGRFAAAGRGMGQSVGQGAESGFKPSLGRISGLLATIGLGKLAADAGKFGLETYMGNEKASISFTTMLGSAEKAQSFLGQMKTFAAQTPFEFPELQTASSRLISAGVNADKVIPIMRTLGDVTSGMGTGADGVNRATVALQQMQAAGRITGEDLNQLRDAGIPVYDLLASATGKSKAEIVKMAQAGKLGKKELDAMMGALESGKGLEKFNGLMEAQSRGLEGMLSNLKDTLGTELSQAIDQSGLGDDLKGAISAVTAALPGIIGGVKSFVGWLRQMGQWVQQNASWLSPLAAVLGGVVGGILLVVGAIKAWAVVQAVINTLLLMNPVGVVVMAIAALVAGLIYAYNTSEDFRNAVNTAFTAVGAAARWLWNNALAPAIRAIVNGFAWVVEGIAGMLRALGRVPGFEWATDAADGLDGIARGARDAANGIKDIEAPKDPVVVKVEADGKKARDYLAKMVGEKRAAKILANADTKQGYRDLEKLVGKKRAAQIKAEAKTKAAQDKINAIKGKTVPIKIDVNWIGGLSKKISVDGTGAGKITLRANGGIFRYFAGGGLNENHMAQIARAGDWRVWAEDETGGEAYIPLGASKRNRSIPIWMETGRRLGLLGKAFGVPSLNLGQTGRTVATTHPAAAAAGASSAGPSVFNLFDADGVLLGSIRGEIARNRKHSATVVRMGAR